MATENMYFPLEPGNSWTYRMANGATFTNTVDRREADGGFRVRSTALESEVNMHYDGDTYSSDSFEAGKMLVFLRDGAVPGDSWEIDFQSQGLRNLLQMTVREILDIKEVEGVQYAHVMLLEGESKLVVDAEIMRFDFFTQYYYAKDIGLILTTSSRGDYMPLISYSLASAAGGSNG